MADGILPAPSGAVKERARAGGRLYLLVRVRGANGGAVEAVYELVREDHGWRINGVATRH